jgi:hypothetical protein
MAHTFLPLHFFQPSFSGTRSSLFDESTLDSRQKSLPIAARRIQDIIGSLTWAAIKMISWHSLHPLQRKAKPESQAQEVAKKQLINPA